MDYRALVQKLGDRTNQNTQTSELILEHRTGHPTCQVKSLNDVFSAATKLRTDWNIGNAAITNVINILETNGIIVVEVEASDAFHCFIFQKIWMKRWKNNTAIYLPMKC